jgi:anthranilate synthase/aminodeoxychorismate synthase-like glutamine amidotransferase
MNVLFIDNYDSFTYNVVHLLASQGANIDVMLNDDEKLAPEILTNYSAVVVGPGPGRPADFQRMMEVLNAAIQRKLPVLGVCLGQQAIGEALGATVTHAPQLMHGKVSQITHNGTGIFAGLESPLSETRYHSLCLDPSSIPPDLTVTATSPDGVIQAIAHTSLPIHAVQFHPESVLSQHGKTLIHNFLALINT